MAQHEAASRRRTIVAVGLASLVVAGAAVILPVMIGRTGTATGPLPDRPQGTPGAGTPIAGPARLGSLGCYQDGLRPGDLPRYVCATGLTGTPPMWQPGVTPTEVAWPQAKSTPVHYSADELRRRGAAMQSHVASRVPALLPQATKVTVHPASQTEYPDYLVGFTSFTVNGAPTALSVHVHAPGAARSPRLESWCSDGCALDRMPDGGYLLIETKESGNGAIFLTAKNFRPTGTVVSATAYNYDPPADGSSPKYLPSVPIGHEPLTALATDPTIEL